MVETQIKTSWNKGLRHSDEHKNNLRSAWERTKKERTGENSSVWKGGLPNCLDCKKRLVSYKAKRCHPCAMKTLRKGNKHGYEHGFSCEICNKPTVNGYVRCGSHKIISMNLREKFREAQLKRLKDGTWSNQYGGYIEDRSKLKRYGEDNLRRTDPAYHYWSTEVKKRDNFKCKIANRDCDGRLEAHHILGWTEYVELRYEINNGITLCHAHHPRRRAEEKRLSPYFMGLVSVSN